MRILDTASGTSLEDVILYLTYSEAVELKDSLENLLRRPMCNHLHVTDNAFSKQVTVCIYDTNDLQGFDKRSINLILNDE